MKKRLLDVLCCPGCRGDLQLGQCTTEEIKGPSGETFTEVNEGVLECEGCGKSYPIEGGIPRFVPTDGYVPNFSIQWRKLRSSSKPPKVHRTESQFLSRTDFSPRNLEGKWVLEAGCGAGRFR